MHVSQVVSAVKAHLSRQRFVNPLPTACLSQVRVDLELKGNGVTQAVYRRNVAHLAVSWGVTWCIDTGTPLDNAWLQSYGKTLGAMIIAWYAGATTAQDDQDGRLHRLKNAGDKLREKIESVLLGGTVGLGPMPQNVEDPWLSLEM